MKEIKGKIYTCYHCGNKGVLQFIKSTVNEWVHEEKNEQGFIIGETLLERDEWCLYQCPVCKKPTLVRESWDIGMPDDYFDETIEYPSQYADYTGVPNEIRDAFESAIKTKGIDWSICLLSLRRTLEMICKDKNAVGKNLESKIQDLINKKVLPDMLDDACWIIRQTGNDAAHADDVKYYPYQVEQIIRYLGTIIDYLYSLPIKISKMKSEIETRKEKGTDIDWDAI